MTLAGARRAIEVYCSVLLMAGIVHSLLRPREYPTDDDVFEMLRPLLQGSLILIDAFAGFAKLKRDFFDPAVSCAAGILEPLLEPWHLTARQRRSSSRHSPCRWRTD